MKAWKAPLTKKGKPCLRCKPGHICTAHDGRGRKGGAPTAFTHQRKTDFLAAIRAGGPSNRSLAAACRFVGWHEETFRLWRRAYEKGEGLPEILHFFGEELPKAQEARRLKAYSVLAKSMDSQDAGVALAAAKFTLEKLHGADLEIPTQKITVSHEEREVLSLRDLVKVHAEA